MGFFCMLTYGTLRRKWLGIPRLFFCFQTLMDLLKSVNRSPTTIEANFVARILIVIAFSTGRGIWRGISDMSAVLCRASSVLIASIVANSNSMLKNTSLEDTRISEFTSWTSSRILAPRSARKWMNNEANRGFHFNFYIGQID